MRRVAAPLLRIAKAAHDACMRARESVTCDLCGLGLPMHACMCACKHVMHARALRQRCLTAMRDDASVMHAPHAAHFGRHHNRSGALPPRAHARLAPHPRLEMPLGLHAHAACMHARDAKGVRGLWARRTLRSRPARRMCVQWTLSMHGARGEVQYEYECEHVHQKELASGQIRSDQDRHACIHACMMALLNACASAAIAEQPPAKAAASTIEGTPPSAVQGAHGNKVPARCRGSSQMHSAKPAGRLQVAASEECAHMHACVRP